MVPDWKTKGKRRTLADSFGDAARGILFAVKTERNMRIHVTAAVYVLFFARFLGVSRGEYAALLLAVALVITAEGFNTAIEMLCDYAQKSYNRFIGRTKDIAAGGGAHQRRFCRFCRCDGAVAAQGAVGARGADLHLAAVVPGLSGCHRAGARVHISRPPRASRGCSSGKKGDDGAAVKRPVRERPRSAEQ